MKPLLEYIKNQYHFKLVERRGDYAIFAGNKPDKDNTNWEVIHLRVTTEGSRIVHDPKTNTDIPISWEAHERPPSDNEWGNHGWTCLTKETALIRLNALTQTLTQQPPTHEPTRPAIL
jgi:hypothetical protein